MEYVAEFPEDAKVHRGYHDKIVNGIYAPRIKSDEVVWEKDDYRITVVNYFSPRTQKIRAGKAAVVANKDTPFDFAPYYSREPLDDRNVHIFLLYIKSRIIGFLIVERRDTVWSFTWKEYEKAVRKNTLQVEPLWSIGLAWIHHKHRRRGLGAQLVQTAASHFDLETHSSGWYTPFTDDGEKLAKSLCHKSFFCAK